MQAFMLMFLAFHLKEIIRSLNELVQLCKRLDYIKCRFIRPPYPQQRRYDSGKEEGIFSMFQ